MTVLRTSLCVFLFLAAIVLAAEDSDAASMAYEVEIGREPHFQFSYIHDGRYGRTFKMGGRKLFSLSGTLTGQLVDGTLTLDPNISLSATGMRWTRFAGQSWTLLITSGEFVTYAAADAGATNPLSDPHAADGFLGGSFDYVLSRDDGRYAVDGSFYFFPRDFMGSPNSLSASQLAIWGNNWNNLTQRPPRYRHYGLSRLGLDIRAQGFAPPSSAPPMPEPNAFLLFSLGGLITGVRLRARRRRR